MCVHLGLMFDTEKQGTANEDMAGKLDHLFIIIWTGWNITKDVFIFEW